MVVDLVYVGEGLTVRVLNQVLGIPVTEELVVTLVERVTNHVVTTGDPETVLLAVVVPVPQVVILFVP